MANRTLHTGQAPRSTVDRAAAPKCRALLASVRVARRSADGALCPLPRVPWGSLYRTPADAPSRCRRFNCILSDGKGRLRAIRSRGRALAVLETKRTSSDLSLSGEAQGRRHASDRRKSETIAVSDKERHREKEIPWCREFRGASPCRLGAPGKKAVVLQPRLAVAEPLAIEAEHMPAGGFKHGLPCGGIPLHRRPEARVKIGL